jgi:DDE_Tnp_1-associated
MDAVELGRSLQEAFAQVPDPRSPHGRRHPLPAILALATAAMLSNAHSLYAIAQWGRLQSPEVVHALGFTRDQTPTVSSLHLVFKRLDVEALEVALAGWAQRHLGDDGEAIAIDGKALRGRHGKDPESGWVDVVAAYAQQAGQVLAQAGGEDQ